MKTLSIRGVDEDLGRLLKVAAKKEDKSVNNFVLDVLRKQVGTAKEKRFSREWHDLDTLFGTWTDVEYSQIQGRIDAQRQVDEELWK
jgi:plasmid stability protein